MSKLVLPIGSIVELIESSEKVIVVGYLMKNVSTNYVYDYCGCKYPFGFVNKNKMLYFDKKDIRVIKKIGYMDDEFEEKSALISNALKDKKVL